MLNPWYDKDAVWYGRGKNEFMKGCAEAEAPGYDIVFSAGVIDPVPMWRYKNPEEADTLVFNILRGESSVLVYLVESPRELTGRINKLALYCMYTGLKDYFEIPSTVHCLAFNNEECMSISYNGNWTVDDRPGWWLPSMGIVKNTSVWRADSNLQIVLPDLRAFHVYVQRPEILERDEALYAYVYWVMSTYAICHFPCKIGFIYEGHEIWASVYVRPKQGLIFKVRRH